VILKRILLVILAILASYTLYAYSQSPSQNDPDDRFTDPTKINMTLEIDSSGPSAKISFHTLEKEDSPAKGYVEIPYKKTVFSSGASVMVVAARDDEVVYCKIVNGYSGKVLDSAGPSRVANCDYSTF
jgi:hypothetical protein